MGRKTVPQLDQGSVLGIPLQHDCWALAQVLVPGTVFYLGAAPVRFAQLPSPPDIAGLPLSVFSWTNDAEVYRGRWRVLGQYELQGSSRPAIQYKVAVSGKMMVESFDGTSLRDYDEQADSHLGHRTSRSPLLFEDIVRATVASCAG
jgi:hypothetical protein